MLILVAQSVRLVVGVVHDKFAINETWDSLRIDLNDVQAQIHDVGSFSHNNR
jgi:hypothetical protein